MLFASGATAVGIAASTADSDEAGGQDWAFGLELFLAGLKEAADQIINDKGAGWSNELALQFFKQWWAKVRERAAVNGVTTL